MKIFSRCSLLVGIGALLLAGCGQVIIFPEQFDTNGEQIYYTGINANGLRIPYTGGPASGMMMSPDLACASCHGDDGRGGTRFMHMRRVNAPDIRISTLRAHTEDHNETEPHGHAEEEHGGEYNLETFRLAVIEGKHPDGERLSTDMPRWELSDADLADLFEFLKTLP